VNINSMCTVYTAAVPNLSCSRHGCYQRRAVIKAEIAGITVFACEGGGREAWDIWINGRVWGLMKADSGHEDCWQLGVTISVRVSLSEAMFAKYSLPLGSCIDSNYPSI